MIQKKHFNKLIFFALPVLSGILIGTSYIPFPPWAIFFGLVPLWMSWLKSKTLKQVLFAGWITQFVFTSIGFSWVSYTISEFGKVPWPWNFGLFFIYCSFANLHIPLAGALFHFFRRLTSASNYPLLILPAVVTLSELSFPMIFDWNFGYTWLWLGWPAFHLAEWIGFSGLSFITIFLNLIPLQFALFLKARSKSGLSRHWLKPAIFSLTSLALSLLLLNGLGLFVQSRIQKPDQTLKVLTTQANIANLEIQYAYFGRGFLDKIINKYIDVTESHLKSQGNPQVDFVVWPETAFPEPIDQALPPTPRLGRVEAFMKRNNVDLFTGSYGRRPESRISNSVTYFSKDKKMDEALHYDKTHLLAFGEYFPGADWMPKLREWFPQVANFYPGEGALLFRTDKVLLGPQICYEGLFDRFARKSGQLGAQVLINVTNDSWYGVSSEPYQHLYMTLARAIENRRPLIRATNTGITTVITADGRVMEQSPLFKVWAHIFEVPYSSKPKKTFFQGLGYTFSWFFSLVLIVIALWRFKKI